MKSVAGKIRAWGACEEWLLLPTFMVPLPAVAFAWWFVIAKPLWMAEPLVLRAVLLGYLVGALYPLPGLVLQRQSRTALANSLTLACVCLCGAAALLCLAPVAIWLVILGSLAGAAGISSAMHEIILRTADVTDRRGVNYLLVVLPATSALVAAQTVLWTSDRWNLVRLSAAFVAAVAVFGGIGWLRGYPRPVSALPTMLVLGVTLAALAEALRLLGGAEYRWAAYVLHAFGGRFLAYFGAAACLVSLPMVFAPPDAPEEENGRRA